MPTQVPGFRFEGTYEAAAPSPSRLMIEAHYSRHVLATWTDCVCRIGALRNLSKPTPPNTNTSELHLFSTRCANSRRIVALPGNPYCPNPAFMASATPPYDDQAGDIPCSPMLKLDPRPLMLLKERCNSVALFDLVLFDNDQIHLKLVKSACPQPSTRWHSYPGGHRRAGWPVPLRFQGIKECQL